MDKSGRNKLKAEIIEALVEKFETVANCPNEVGFENAEDCLLESANCATCWSKSIIPFVDAMLQDLGDSEESED